MIDFDYTSPEEIKNILNKFLKSNFSTEKLTAFIKEICVEYSELLFFSNKSLNELRDLETLKNALNERFRRYQKLSVALENEINSLKSQKVTQPKEEVVPKNNYESMYYKAMQELNMIRGQLESQQIKSQILKSKEENLFCDFISFKNLYVKELLITKMELDEVTKQRNAINDQMIEFKTFFNNTIKNE